MSVKDSKIAYSSNWDIDQLINTGTTPVGSGISTVYTIPSTIPPIPVFEVQFQPTGSVFWYDPGTSSTDGTLTNLFTFFTYIAGGVININTTSTGIARYFIWSDKVDY